MNSTPESHTLDDWYRYYGTTRLVDILYMYALTPLSALSFIFNSLTLVVLLKSPFNKSPIFSYLRIYIANSVILSALMITVFVSNTYRIFSFTNTYGAIAYGAYFHTPVTSIFYFYGTLVEIFISLERSLKFLPARFRLNAVTKFKTVCFSGFVFSLVLNLPVFFIYYPQWSDVELETNTTFRINYWALTDFQVSLYGKVLNFVVNFVRDVLFLVFKIGLNIVSVYIVRRYLGKIKLSVTSVTLKLNMETSQVTNKDYVNKTDRNLTLMAIVMSVLSIFENIFYAVVYTYYAISPNEVSYGLFFLSYFSIAFKNCLNFFVLFRLNNMFRIEFRKTF